MAKTKKISTQTIPLVAIDMGSDKFRAIAAERLENGTLHISGSEQLGRNACVERGVVINSSEAGYMIKCVTELLTNRLRLKDRIVTAFTALGGQNMKIVKVHSVRDQIRKREVSPALLEEMKAECKYKIEGRNPQAAVLDLIPYFFTLDGVEQDEEPTPDQKVAVVDANYIAFIGPKNLEQKVMDSFQRGTILVEGAFARPDALLTALASEKDMREGCAILDMGAQTTTLTIFKGTQYLATQVVSVGGHDITSYIAQQGMPNDKAEELKCTYGWASPALVSRNYRFRIPSKALPGGELVLMSDELAQLISEKIDQAVNPLMEVLNEYANRLSVLYLTGGASLLQGMEAYLQTKTTLPVMYGSHAEWLDEDTPDAYCSPVWSGLIGTLLLGANHRREHAPEVEIPSKGKWFPKPKIKEWTLDLFTETPDKE